MPLAAIDLPLIKLIVKVGVPLVVVLFGGCYWAFQWMYSKVSNPRGALVAGARAYALRSEGDLEGALLEINKAIELDSDNADHLFERGMIHYDLEDNTSSLADFTQYISLKPTEGAAQFMRGLIYHKQEQYGPAVSNFTEAIRFVPDRANFYVSRGLALECLGEEERALQDFTKAIEIDPEQASAKKNRSLIFSSRGQLREALEDLNEVIEANPRDAASLNRRGIIWYQFRQFARAIEDYSAAIRLMPESANFYANRGYSRRDSGDTEGAMSDFAEALRLEPRSTHALSGRSGLWANMGRGREALADADLACQIDLPGGQLARGLAKISLGQFDSGFRDLKEHQRRNPQDAQAANRIGWMRATLVDPGVRNPDEALHYARLACEMTGWKNPSLLDTLAAALADAGKMAEAVKLQTQIVEALGDSSPEYQQRLDLYASGRPYRQEFSQL